MPTFYGMLRRGKTHEGVPLCLPHQPGWGHSIFILISILINTHPYFWQWEDNRRRKGGRRQGFVCHLNFKQLKLFTRIQWATKGAEHTQRTLVSREVCQATWVGDGAAQSSTETVARFFRHPAPKMACQTFCSLCIRKGYPSWYYLPQLY